MPGSDQLIRFLVVPYLKRSTQSLSSTIDAVDFAFSFNYLGIRIRPEQIKSEIVRLLGLVRERDPTTVLEIGTALGGTLFLFTRVASVGATIVSVDLPTSTHHARRLLFRAFAREGQTIHLIGSDSHNPSTLAQVRKKLVPVDVLFIDGDHTYEGVKKDFEMYSPLVRSGGLIAFHDIVPHPPQAGCKVNEFWGQLRSDYRFLEIVEKKDQGWGGIGVIFQNEGGKAPLWRLPHARRKR